MLFDLATERGWDVAKRGWPDFFLQRRDEIIAVEVKGHKDEPLKVDQERIFEFLTNHGVRCYKWSPDVAPDFLSEPPVDPYYELLKEMP